jgi:gamma-glutamylcysteine synthetase
VLPETVRIVGVSANSRGQSRFYSTNGGPTCVKLTDFAVSALAVSGEKFTLTPITRMGEVIGLAVQVDGRHVMFSPGEQFKDAYAVGTWVGD